MKTKNTKYKICDYNHTPDMVSYINSDTKNPQEGWVTNIPIHGKLKQKPTPIKYFSTKSEAKEYLDSIRKQRINDWEKNEVFYKLNGYKKPVWKIYTENEK
jgi:hypothetical protein